jgi:ATP adenylyltransferase
MKQLWAPWRLEYVQHADDADDCVFCRAAALPEDEPELVIQRGELPFVLLNKFPYASAQLRISPYRHGSAFDDLEDAETLEVQQLAVQAIEALRAVFAPEGFNVGWNLGRVAGAGIVDHGHVHVVPRWSGDTNFMPVLADIKVIPEHLLETRRKLADAWPTR